MKNLIITLLMLFSSHLMAKSEVFECQGISIKENKLTLPDEASKKLSIANPSSLPHDPIQHSCQSQVSGKDHYSFRIDVTKSHVIIKQQSDRAKFGPVVYIIE